MKRVTENVRIFDVHIAGETVVVDLYGGETNAFGAVTFHYEGQPAERGNAYLTFLEWMNQDTPLDLYENKDEIKLINRNRPLQDPGKWGLEPKWKDIEE